MSPGTSLYRGLSCTRYGDEPRCAAAWGGAVQTLPRSALEEKVRDIVGLYLNPPDRAWYCVWTKRARSALDRTAPILPLRPETAGTSDARLQTQWHHDSVRCLQHSERQSHRHLPATPRQAEFVKFLNHLEQQFPRIRKSISLWTTTAPIRAPRCSADRRTKRFHFHFTPPQFLAEPGRTVLALITGRMIRRGTFHSARS